MRAPSTTKEWLLTVAGGVVTTVIIFGLVGVRAHFAQSGETDDRALENEQRNVEQDAELAPIRKLVEKLGKIHTDLDAAEAERAKLCTMGLIDDALLCGAVGVEIVK